METNRLAVMVESVFPQIVRACRAAIIPALRKKGVEIISKGADLGEIVTEMDVNASRILLDGNEQFNVVGLRSLLPGSFSEEDDSPERVTRTEIYQNDPCDGTGDAVKLGISPTNLTSLLDRPFAHHEYAPIAAIIYDVLGEFGIVSDGSEVLMGTAHPNGAFCNIPIRVYSGRSWQRRWAIRLNHRTAYPQENAHQHFPEFLTGRGMQIRKVPTAGSGTQALQLFRNFIEPENPHDLPKFWGMRPIDVIFNCQPDWKTWDTDPTRVVARALGLPQPTSIYGAPLTANAAAPTLRQMHHECGCLFAVNQELLDMIISAAHSFEDCAPFDKSPHAPHNLLVKNY